MNIAVVSRDFTTITGQTDHARRFLIFKALPGQNLRLQQQLEMSADTPTLHQLHDDDSTQHPLDDMVLITAEASFDLKERLRTRGITLLITSETDPANAVSMFLQRALPQLAATPDTGELRQKKRKR